MISNDDIAEKLEKLGNLLEILGENSFKVAAYYKAARAIEGLEEEVSTLAAEKRLAEIPGAGDAIRSKIEEIVATGTCAKLTEVEGLVPAGVADMLRIRGLGPKKIIVIWKELGIESVGELLYACNENRLVQAKGFGEKTQDKVRQAIVFLHQNENLFHYASLRPVADAFLKQARKWTNGLVELTGDIRRKMPVLSSIDVLVEADALGAVSSQAQAAAEYQLESEDENKTVLRLAETAIRIVLNKAQGDFWKSLFESTGSEAHLAQVQVKGEAFASEEAVYASAGLPYIEPERREGIGEVEQARNGSMPRLIEWGDIRGSVHNHSTWSDGIHSLEQMARACIERGWEYLGICDHSKTAFYANGLKEDRVAAQHREIEQLNAKLAPFTIFKGIESDILPDGSLDYSDEVLASFDFIVASVHSQLSMTEEKANARLIRAIENPYTTILGHPTGRLLLMRAGYPIDHKKIIDACAANGVMIEINANPWRLDIDWQWVPYCLEKGVMLSVNPDAHKMEGFDDTRWGIEAGRKGGLTAERTLNCQPAAKVAALFAQKKGK